MYTAYAQYTAYFEDPAEFEFAVGLIPQDGSVGVAICPVDAAAMFDIPWPPPSGALGPKGFYFQDPYRPGINIPHPGPSGVTLDPAILSFVVAGQTLPGFARGDDMTLVWSLGVVRKGPEYGTADPSLIAPIPPRRWAFGAEASGSMEFHPNGSSGNRSRDASRTVDGIGIKIRGDVPGTGLITTSLSNSEGASLPTKKSWERFYFRIRQTGIVQFQNLWYASGDISTSSGARISINPDRSITAYNVNAAGTNDTTFGSTAALLLNMWYRVDVLCIFTNGVTSGSLRVYLNGVLAISGTKGPATDGLGTNQNHGATAVLGIGVTNTWEIDFDDWHNAQIPNIAGVEFLNSLDWLIGTHVKSSHIVSGTAPNWTGIIQAMNQFAQPAGSSLFLGASIATSTITALTDVIDFGDVESQDASGLNMGAACISFSMNALQGGGIGNNGRLGYSIAGGSSVLTTQTLPGVPADVSKAYLPSGSLTPYPVFPASIVYEKGPLANSATVMAMVACTQYIGLWGPEDGVEGQDPGMEFNKLLHNCRYPYLGWAIMGATPDAPCCVTGGTYVGNGTFQSIALNLPCHLLIIRNISTGIPVIVTTTMLTPESAGTGEGLAGDIPILASDPITGIAYFTVVGNGPRVNQLSSNYQYFAFCDPGLRYLINGELSHGNSALTFNNLLIDSTFTPEFAMAFATSAAPGGIWFKGPRHVALEMSSIVGTLISNGMQFNNGAILSGDGISEGSNATAYSVFRTIDGSAVTMVQVTSFVGNGAASRVIPLTPISNRFPLVAFVVRRGTAAVVYRDTSHAGANSMTMVNGGNVANGIIAGGVDSITVGTLCNTNLAEFDVFVIPGSGSGWLNGTFCGPNGLAPGDFWPPDSEPLPPGVAILTDGGLILGGTSSLTLLKNISGIYTLVPGKHTDTYYDRQVAQPNIDLEIPDPTFGTGYIGG